jgi:hypothetical protein
MARRGSRSESVDCARPESPFGMMDFLVLSPKKSLTKSVRVAKGFPGITLCFFPKGRNRVETDEIEASTSILMAVITY